MLLGLTFFGWSLLSYFCVARNRLIRCAGLGTVMCGLAPSMEVLIAARAVAGMGGGGSVMHQLNFICG